MSTTSQVAFLPRQSEISCFCLVTCMLARNSAPVHSCLTDTLTAELHAEEALGAQVLQEHSRGSAGFEEEGDIRGCFGM